jgi:hypothetical protein
MLALSPGLSLQALFGHLNSAAALATLSPFSLRRPEPPEGEPELSQSDR